ncbi:hypothetical protein ACS5PK_13715 [Roseateles sp. DB2]|uniref:hypothetical protein n=1 Tax=Roseateles sp. DB2 TaxID=3453717 RepID=UPI003EE9250A
MKISRRRLGFASLAAAALPLISACAHRGELRTLELPAKDRELEAQPFGAVDVVLVARPSLKPKLDWWGSTNVTSVRQVELENEVALTMRNLRGELHDVLYWAGLPGRVSLEGRPGTPGRTHVLVIVPMEASKTSSSTHFSTTVELRLIQLSSKHSLWRAQSVVGSGREDGLFAQSVLTQLKALGVSMTPRVQEPARVEGLPAQLGETLAAVQAALGPGALLSAEREGSSLALDAAGALMKFNAQGQLMHLRLKAPATATVRGVAVGDTLSSVRNRLGEPSRTVGELAFGIPVGGPSTVIYKGPAFKLSLDLGRDGITERVRQIRLDAPD